MKTTYIYYPGLAIAIILFILNVDLIWVFIALLLGWVSVIDNWKINDPSVVVFFPLTKKFLKFLKNKKNDNI